MRHIAIVFSELNDVKIWRVRKDYVNKGSIKGSKVALYMGLNLFFVAYIAKVNMIAITWNAPCRF